MSKKNNYIFDCIDTDKVTEELKNTKVVADMSLKGTKKLTKRKKKARKQRIKKDSKLLTYEQYMMSGLWDERKNAYWQKYGRYCSICNTSSHVTLHHMVYDKKLYGKEPDEHVVPLCNYHHNMYHMYHKTKKDMRVETERFIYNQKNKLTLRD